MYAKKHTNCSSDEGAQMPLKTGQTKQIGFRKLFKNAQVIINEVLTPQTITKITTHTVHSANHRLRFIPTFHCDISDGERRYFNEEGIWRLARLLLSWGNTLKCYYDQILYPLKF